MEIKRSCHCPDAGTIGQGHAKYHAAVELALGSTCFMHGTDNPVAGRPQETACPGMLFYPCGLKKQLPFIVIHPCQERCTRGNGKAFEFKGADLLLNRDVIAKVHAA